MKNLMTVAFLMTIVVPIITGISLVYGDNKHRYKKWARLEERRQHSVGVGNVNTPLYQEECGACHMAYPPGLLPARSWRVLLEDLENHFDDNAELDSTVLPVLRQLLLENSADNSSYRRSQKFARSIAYNDAPIRITDTPYFLHKHDELSADMVSQNSEVTSLASCEACHKYAEKGSFSEREIWIPGFGRWDD